VYQDSLVTPPGLEALTRHATVTGVFLDFDGTLSEIAPTPEDARAVEGLGPVLERLVARYRVVAIVSGRPASQVEALVGVPVRFFGLYGLEDERGPAADAERLAAAAEEAFPEIERAAAYVPGTRVERKGLSVAVHYRGVPEPEAARRVLLERLGAVARARDLQVMEGKRVVELAAGPRPSKGDVLRRVARAEGLRYLLFAGDDLADLEAFDAVEALASEGLMGIRVAVRSPETPDRLVERADLVVEGPRGLLALLSKLVP
jgi:trehalose 6-phosphate phosphatase